MKIEEFLKLAAAQGLTVYPKSADESEGTVCAIARDASGKKVLLAAGEKAAGLPERQRTASSAAP